MNLYFNDYSLHGQFSDVASFEEAIGRLMLMKKLALDFGTPMYCHRTCLESQVTHDKKLPQLINQLSRDRKMLLLNWFTKSGPYWDEIRQHSSDEYLDCQGHVVTDSVIGECAFLRFSGEEVQLASITPSDWESQSLEVFLHQDNQDIEAIELQNHIASDTLEKALRAAPILISSWNELSNSCIERFGALVFLEDAFEPLKGVPFHPGVAQSFIRRLDVLNQLKLAFDTDGNRTPEGNTLYQDYFVGNKAWFSDSGDQEKIDFKQNLTFEHPDINENTIFATWHGKIKTPQMRIHFGWDFSCQQPVHVVYIGPKITKR